MSGYGGQPPGWNDPYGQGQGWNDPNAAQHHQSPGYAYGYGPPGVPNTAGETSGSTIAALICNCVAVAMCCNLLTIPGIVTAAMAMSRARTDPASSRKLTTWSWGILVVAFLLPVVIFCVLLGVDAANGGLDDSGL
ncbi:hypothetical protein [Actinomadura rugatobispora]|uniref:DUF4190 domain-containing protein n=1 Tax=Actinomadura rugatobispora TaxID=1994 RepID=A0ABW1A0P8_9ACTN|nr:hypothetical protein GCM10010200_052340 [Actinomadura rugatobispora]